ncbi:MAG: response regulator transcription factor [Rhodospirillales bacterium]|jgi:DNA-binding NarL/FixJ family response regulator|nr:response regulator transcription factor [Rhodospirillales bacterium]MDP6772807.1 response regulator transcription factor [Rhodospirillales bacterium]|tara:strand:+ start:1002 stop:1529 length:528 start_codon:yes stop_codon:yes gene_type:complete
MSEAYATDDNDRAAQSTGMKVLLADDHASYRDLISQALRKAHPDVTVIEARNLAEALQVARAHDDLSLAIVDLIMPGMDGFAGIAALRDRLPEIPIVVVSALSRPRYVRQAYDHGADGFVPKTANAKPLLGALDVVLSGGVYVPPEALEAGGGGPLEAALRAAKTGLFGRQGSDR